MPDDPLTPIDPLQPEASEEDHQHRAVPESGPLNPYAPTVELSAEQAVMATEAPQPLTLRRTAVRWFTVCIIAALPSFFYGFGLTGGRISGMLMGIFLFAVGYTFLDYRTAQWPIRQRKTVRRTLRITYGTRVAISLLFPVGMYLDLICGIVSLTILEPILGEPPIGSGSNRMSFTTSLITTLVQGCVLNAVLGVYGLLVHGIQAVVIALKR